MHLTFFLFILILKFFISAHSVLLVFELNFCHIKVSNKILIIIIINIVIIIIIIIVIIIINLPGLTWKNAWLRPRKLSDILLLVTIFTKIFYSSKSVYIIHEGYSQNAVQLITFAFPSIESSLFKISIHLFYLSFVHNHECEFLKQYQFVFVYSTFPKRE